LAHGSRAAAARGVADRCDVNDLLVISGAGDVIEPDDGVIAIGSGGNHALAAARVLVKHTQLDARVIAEEAMKWRRDLRYQRAAHL
jgi:ATP-dependent HslUV protease subunit HslV